MSTCSAPANVPAGVAYEHPVDALLSVSSSTRNSVVAARAVNGIRATSTARIWKTVLLTRRMFDIAPSFYRPGTSGPRPIRHDEGRDITSETKKRRLAPPFETPVHPAPSEKRAAPQRQIRLSVPVAAVLLFDLDVHREERPIFHHCLDFHPVA